jgi:hypothetical protein
MYNISLIGIVTVSPIHHNEYILIFLKKRKHRKIHILLLVLIELSMVSIYN